MSPAPAFGLTTREVQDRLAKYGTNQLPPPPSPHPLTLLVSQLQNPLIYILLAAAAITLFFIKDLADFAIIMVAIGLNTFVGFFQEQKATRTLNSLSLLLTPQAKVIRDGKRQIIPAASLVPGDLVILNRGDKVPADGLLVFTDSLFVNEAILTGESQPQPKSPAQNLKHLTPAHSVCMGTLVTAGVGRFIVEATGTHTQIGHISQTITNIEESTPLKLQLKNLTRTLTFLIVALVILIFLLGLLFGNSLKDIFLTSVALAVSTIPEGLLISLAVILALAIARIAKHKGLVKRLYSAETLGSVTVICADKTGTLTAGHVKAVSAHFTNQKLGILSSLLVNDLHNPLEQAMWDWGESQIKKLSQDFNSTDDVVKAYPRLDEIPFSSKTKFIATLNQMHEKKRVFVSGAPEIILAWTTLSSKEKATWQAKFQDWANQGRRLVGFAYRPAKKNESRLITSTLTHHLTWLGAMVFDDPVRDSVAPAIIKAQKAGLKVKIITGDYPETCRAILSQIGLPLNSPSQVITGDALAKMTHEELTSRLDEIILFARTTPDQKLKIVKALKEKGEIVAMTGDGVNDAPALVEADIGLVVADATDLAKETADMVLLDSNFATIVSSIEEGRAIFANFRKVVLYLLADAFAGMILILGTIFSHLPLPLTAAQIIWINIISNGLPSLALTLDPKEKDLMSRPPRPPRENIINLPIALLIGLVSTFAGLMAFYIFKTFYSQTLNLNLARSFTFIVLGVTSHLYVFSCRSLNHFFVSPKLAPNKWLLGAVALGFLLQALPLYFTPLNSTFDLLPVPSLYWAVAFAVGFVLVALVEVTKLAFRRPSA